MSARRLALLAAACAIAASETALWLQVRYLSRSEAECRRRQHEHRYVPASPVPGEGLYGRFPPPPSDCGITPLTDPALKEKQS